MSKAIAILVVAAPLIGFSCHAQTVLPAPVDSFVASTGALATSAKDDITLGRTNERLRLIRSMISEAIQKKSTQLQLSKLGEVSLLCKPRVDLLQLTAQRNYLQSVSASINKVGTPSKIDNLSQAIGALFANQSVDVKGIPDEAALKAEQGSLMKLCRDDLANLAIPYYGAPFPPSKKGEKSLALPAAFTAVGSLLNTIVSIITPVVVEGAKIIDAQKRTNAVLKFLTPANIRQIQSTGEQLSKGVTHYVVSKRRSLAGAFNDSLVMLRTEKIDLTKLQGCKAYNASTQKFALRPSGTPNDDYVACWHAVWTKLSPLTERVLKSASAYDEIADAGNTNDAKKAFNLISRSLNAIAKENDTMSQANLRKLWNWAVQLMAFADKVNTAASPDNQKKIQKQIDALVKSLS